MTRIQYDVGMAFCFVLVVEQAVGLGVVVLVAVAKKQWVVGGLADCVMWAQAHCVNVVVIGHGLG